MENKYKVIRFVAYIIEIIIFFSIQQTPNLLPFIYGAKPLLLIPILVNIALFEDEMIGLWFGVFIGFLMDFGFSNILGFNCIILAICGCILGLMSVNLIKVNLLTSTISVISVAVIVYSLQFVFFYLLRMYGANDYMMLYHYLPRLGYTVLVSPIFYFLNKVIAIQIRPKDS